MGHAVGHGARQLSNIHKLPNGRYPRMDGHYATAPTTFNVTKELESLLPVLDVSSFADSGSATAATSSSRSVLQTMLEVEQAVNVCLVEHGTAVVRVVHTPSAAAMSIFGAAPESCIDGSCLSATGAAFVAVSTCLLSMSTTCCKTMCGHKRIRISMGTFVSLVSKSASAEV